MMNDIWMGWLSRESGKSGYACMGDRGRAFGAYQFDYRYSLVPFLEEAVSKGFSQLAPYAAMRVGDKTLIGNVGLRDVWRDLAGVEAFCRLQDDFARCYYYEPAAKTLRELGVDPDTHSAAFRGSLFSMAIRSGTETGAKKMATLKEGAEEDVLRAAYATYGSEDAGRWPEQLADALAAWESEWKNTLRLGSTGQPVKEWQELLMQAGSCDCADYRNPDAFCDGHFGTITKQYTEILQVALGIPKTGEVNALTYARVKKALDVPTTTPTPDAIMAACKLLTAAYKTRHFKWGNCLAAPWLLRENTLISCDRFVDDVLYRCGLPHIGNRAADTLPAFFEANGAARISSASDVRAGDVVFTNDGEHVFFAAGPGSRYDCGGDARIGFIQPSQEPILDFAYAYRFAKSATDSSPKDISRNSQGRAVKVWQAICGAEPDGKFGTLTEAATRNFQAKHGLEATGKVDALAWRAGWEDLCKER